jgi:hypothetical protein
MIARVYAAGPYTKGDVALNVRSACEAANRVADLGFAPFVPHATHFWHMLFPPHMSSGSIWTTSSYLVAKLCSVCPGRQVANILTVTAGCSRIHILA